VQGGLPPGPTRPLFESEDLDARLARKRLDQETVDFVKQMAEAGGAVIDLGDHNRPLCDQAVAETEHYFATGAVSRVQDAWYRSPAVRQLASLALIRKRLRAAYDRDPFPFQTLNFRRGSEQHFHSDVVHFSSLPERFMCGVWIALEDIHPDSGPLMYKPGSHRLPVLTMRDVGVNSDIPTDEDYERHYVPRFAERLDAANLPTRTLTIKKGQAFVWAANLAHGGSAISNLESTRRSLVVHFLFDRCLYYTPRLSNAESGALHLRLPPNVRTGLWKWPVVGTRPARLPWRMVRQSVEIRLRAEPNAT
jgi:hypothetical protein